MKSSKQMITCTKWDIPWQTFSTSISAKMEGIPVGDICSWSCENLLLIILLCSKRTKQRFVMSRSFQMKNV